MKEVTDLIHQDLDTGVEARSHGIVKDRFESLLLSHDGIEEIGLIDVFRHFLVEIDLSHRLDRISDMDQFEEL
jgi:hypothetical protein